MEQFRHSISDSSWYHLLLSSRQKACQLEVREEAISSHAFSCSICTCKERLGYYHAVSVCTLYQCEHGLVWQVYGSTYQCEHGLVGQVDGQSGGIYWVKPTLGTDLSAIMVERTFGICYSTTMNSLYRNLNIRKLVTMGKHF